MIVSRHPAAIEFIRSQGPEWADVPVLAQATAADVAGAVVAGNLPLHLAALAAEMVAVEFGGAPPRGQEYGLAEMTAAGARLRRYSVLAAPEVQSNLEWSDEDGSRGRRAHLILRRGEELIRFAGKSIPGVVAVCGSDYTKGGKWSHTTYRLRLAAGVAVAFEGHSGLETGTIMESLKADSWVALAFALGVADTPGFRQFVAAWRPGNAYGNSDAAELDGREVALVELEQAG